MAEVKEGHGHFTAMCMEHCYEEILGTEDDSAVDRLLRADLETHNELTGYQIELFRAGNPSYEAKIGVFNCTTRVWSRLKGIWNSQSEFCHSESDPNKRLYWEVQLAAALDRLQAMKNQDEDKDVKLSPYDFHTQIADPKDCPCDFLRRLKFVLASTYGHEDMMNNISNVAEHFMRSKLVLEVLKGDYDPESAFGMFVTDVIFALQIMFRQGPKWDDYQARLAAQEAEASSGGAKRRRYRSRAVCRRE